MVLVLSVSSFLRLQTNIALLLPTFSVYVDKYGRKTKKKVSEKMERFYEIEDDDEETKSKKKGKNTTTGKEEADSGSDSSDSDSEEEVEVDSSSDSDSSDDSSSEEEEVLSESEDDVEHGAMDDATSRLAVMNLDWSRVKSTDILVLFNSFLPGSGYIKVVRIYPSEYGMQQMELVRIIQCVYKYILVQSPSSSALASILCCTPSSSFNLPYFLFCLLLFYFPLVLTFSILGKPSWPSGSVEEGRR